MKFVIPLIAFLFFLGFVAILVIEVPSVDLIIVALIATGLVAYDFLTSAGNSR